MSGLVQPIRWAESVEELYHQYRASTAVRERSRLQVLWLVRGGLSARAAAVQAGVGERTAVRWLGWYRQGGLSAVRERVPGYTAVGRPCRLSEEQKWTLVQESAHGRWRTFEEMRQWVQEHFGVDYTTAGLYSLVHRCTTVHPKVPRPQAEQADPQAQEAWKKGGAAGR